MPARRALPQRRAALGPLIAAGFACGFLLGLAARTVRDGGRGSLWFSVATGSVAFLDSASEFRIERRSHPTLFRLQEADGTAHEHPRLDSLMEMFAREKLSSTGPGDRIRFDVRFRGESGGGDAKREPDLSWTAAIEEESREGATWYRSEHARTGAWLYSRTLEGLKQTIAREFARDFESLLGPYGIR